MPMGSAMVREQVCRVWWRWPAMNGEATPARAARERLQEAACSASAGCNSPRTVGTSSDTVG
jgi:hypothetical protein